MAAKAITAVELRHELEALGFVLRVDNGKLMISPGSKLSAVQRVNVAICRNDLLAMLSPYPLSLAQKDYGEIVEVLGEIQAIAVKAGSRAPMDRAMRALLAVRANTLPLEPKGDK